jgi:hypothetical protein
VIDRVLNPPIETITIAELPCARKTAPMNGMSTSPGGCLDPVERDL